NTIGISVPTNGTDNQVLVRLDHQITNNNHIYGRFWNSHADTPGYLDAHNYLASNVGRTWLNRSTTFNDTHIFGPTLTNEAMFGFNRTDGNNVPIYPPKSITQLGVNNFSD